MGHVSHMYGLYPGDLLTSHRNPLLYEACRKSVLRRLVHEAFTGEWPAAWSVPLLARLKEAEAAALVIKRSCGKLGASMMVDPHLQLDFAFGIGAGVAETLLQSHDDGIELLPALPVSWTEGTAAGLRARGGFDVSFAWKLGSLTRCDVRSMLGGPCHIHGPGIQQLELATEPGKAYQVPVGRR